MIDCPDSGKQATAPLVMFALLPVAPAYYDPNPQRWLNSGVLSKL